MSQSRADQTWRMREFAMRETGPGSAALHAFLTVEERDGALDWREAAMAIAQIANQSHALAVRAVALQAPPIVLACNCKAREIK